MTCATTLLLDPWCPKRLEPNKGNNSMVYIHGRLYFLTKLSSYPVRLFVLTHIWHYACLPLTLVTIYASILPGSLRLQYRKPGRSTDKMWRRSEAVKGWVSNSQMLTALGGQRFFKQTIRRNESVFRYNPVRHTVHLATSAKKTQRAFYWLHLLPKQITSI